MSLHSYNAKRDFKQTAEPKGTINNSGKNLMFVVQKHAASHLHYDFRLELDGVLKSWAVPKGPSMNPEDKRLAVMVEDHPYAYKDFEGTIPKENYGAGTVIVWDQGIYRPIDESSSEQDVLRKGLKEGKISFTLQGSKLKGEFSLVKLKSKQENAWLLVKKKDEYATSKDVLKNNTSVLTQRTLESLKDATRQNTAVVTDEKSLLKVGFIPPMLARTKNNKPFNHPDYLFETKYDGYRVEAVLNKEKVSLWSRNENSFTKSFQPIAKELTKIKHTAVLDGEIVVEDASGKADFQLLQQYMKTGVGTLKYYVFDLLNLDGHATTGLTLLERKELLRLLLEKYTFDSIFFGDYLLEEGTTLFKQAVRNKSEGILAKRVDSTYLVGKRSDDWVKIKIQEQEEAIIIGITAPKKSRNYFGALLLAQFKGGTLVYIGKCGTGFKTSTLKELYELLIPDFISEPPIAEKVSTRDSIQWVQPRLVCQVKFTEWTRDGHLRHPVYLGLRVDKKPKDVVFEVESSNSQDLEITTPPNSTIENNYDLKVGKLKLHLTNQNKIYFPESGVTKGDLVAYYTAVSNYILPYLKNRPQSMHRFPNGITGSSFYQKDVDLEKVPEWLTTVKIPSESAKKELNYLICNNTATLLYMVNLGCIDFNPWNSTVKQLEYPDWMVIDIDPEEHEFKVVVEVALMVKTVLDELEIDCYCKTSGASGLHVYVPLAHKYTYETVKIFAELIARAVQQRLPNTTTLQRSIKKRNHKIYLDYLQNRRGQTLAAPYSIRPKVGATVSTPLEWSEVTDDLHPSQFTIQNVVARLKKKGDLWSPVLGKSVHLKTVLKELTERKVF